LPRHQTLRATLDWSYDLLPETERRLLNHLAVFPAGFTFDAAIAVMSDTENTAGTVEEGIPSLVTKSLITLDGSSPIGRWRLLETTREYALEKLSESGETGNVKRHHAEYFRKLIAPENCREIFDPTEDNLVRSIREIDNIRAALDWAYAPGGDKAIGFALTAACAPIWLYLSLIVECRERIQLALDQLPDASHVNSQLAVQLYVALGVALFETTGLAESSERALARGLSVAERLGDVDSQLRALWGMCMYRLNKGEPRMARPLAERFALLASQKGNEPDILVGDRLLGRTSHYEGQLTKARDHLERFVSRYTAPSGHRHTIWFLYDQHMLARAALARVLCLQGSLARADTLAQAFVRDRPDDHIPSLCYALGTASCPIALLNGQLVEAERSIALLMDLAIRHSLSFWSKLVPCLEGTFLVKRGNIENGVTVLRQGLDSIRASGLDVHSVGFAADLAQGLAAMGRYDDSLAIIADALARQDRTGLTWCTAEFLRIKGEVFLQASDYRDIAAAEECFRQASALAEQQGSLLWQLRCAMSLAGLRIRQNRRNDARMVLAPVFARFTEGFEMADLQSAKAILESL
jgi:predicted ATPase